MIHSMFDNSCHQIADLMAFGLCVVLVTTLPPVSTLTLLGTTSSVGKIDEFKGND